MGKTITLGVTCFAGLGPMVTASLASMPATNIATSRIRDHDFVSFRMDRDALPRLHSLHVIEDAFLQIGRIDRITASGDVRKLCAGLKRSTVLDAITCKNQFSREPAHRRRKAPSYFCFVRQGRDHPIHRKKIAQSVISTIGSVFPRWRASDPADLEFWVFWTKSASLLVRLSDERLKYRSRRPPELRAALRPTIAAAMVELAGVRDGHRVLDPMCGTGTLLLECSARFPKSKVFGSDESADAVSIAKRRLGEKASIRQCAVNDLPHDRETFDRVMANLPWGKQVPVRASVYEAGLARMLDLVVDGGRVVLLTPRRDLVEPTLHRLGARWSATPVRVLGTWASIYVVTKPRNFRRPRPSASPRPAKPM